MRWLEQTSTQELGRDVFRHEFDFILGREPAHREAKALARLVWRHAEGNEYTGRADHAGSTRGSGCCGDMWLKAEE